MATPKWTSEQYHAIHARGGSLLISAGAGSGKTAVLTERVLSRLFDPVDPVDADRLLIVTYTRAAAREMRQRIGRKIEQRQLEFPYDPACRRQRMLLDRAQISTVHSFCQELLRQNFQQLGLTPDFRVADEKELEVWRRESMSTAVEEFYRRGEESFLSLVELLSTGRDDKALLDTAARLYDFARSHPFYRRWMEEKLAAYQEEAPLLQTPWGRSLAEEGRAQLEYIARRSEEMAQRTGFGGLPEAFSDGFAQCAQQARGILCLLEEGRWDEARSRCRQTTLATGIRRNKKLENQPLVEAAVVLRGELKERFETLGNRVFVSTETQFREDLADLRPKVEQLFGLVARFDDLFAQRKRENRAVDFSDLEHLSLTLLMEPGEEPGSYRPTAYAHTVAQGYAEVFVDEYQDTNEVQDMLFRAVSQGEGNLFQVGDVKQSIYRFRQAMPEIFLAKKEAYTPYDGSAYPAKIDLSRNFRSREEVTDGINFFFQRLMTRELGEIDYAAGEELIPGATHYTPVAGAGVQLELLDMAQTDSEEKKAQVEAEYVAGRIAQMLREEMPVQGENGLRPVRPGDICILLRTVKGKATLYREALEQRGISALADAQRGYLESREIAAVLALLRVVDNPLLDVPMAAALLSPLFAFSADQLAQLRAGHRKGSLWQALGEAAKQGDRQAEEFLQLLARLRMMAACLPLDQLVTRLYDATGAEDIFQAMEAGETRRQNLRLLITHAAAYENRGYRGLSGFLRFLDRLQEQGGDLSGAEVLTDSGESVTILSIHKSKGLEFPVVFLCDTAKSFNKQDLNNKVLLHSSLGLATVRREPDTYRQYTTVPLEAVRRDLDRAALSEEMRVLYVAMTRAKERLYLTGAVDNLQRYVNDRCGAGVELSPQRAAKEHATLGWMLLALLQDSSSDSQVLEPGRVLSLPNLPVKCLVAQWEKREEPTAVRQSTAPADPQLLAIFRQRAAFVYPGEAATRLPTKLAISALAHGDGADYRFRRRPRFLHEQGLTPAERGNALHKFMQFCDYMAAKTQPEEEIARLVEQGFLSPAEGAAVDPGKLSAFFHSPLAARIFAAPRVWREYRFLAEAGRGLLAPYTDLHFGEYRTALQGVADCIFLEEDGAVVVDYKTDRVGSPQELLDRYRTQLLLYRELLGASLDIPIKACIIYSFGLSREIVVE